MQDRLATRRRIERKNRPFIECAAAIRCTVKDTAHIREAGLRVRAVATTSEGIEQRIGAGMRLRAPPR